MTSLLSKGPAWLENQYSTVPQQDDIDGHEDDSYDEAVTDAPAGLEDEEQDQVTLKQRLQKIVRRAAAGASYTPHTIFGVALAISLLVAFLGASLVIWVVFVRWLVPASVETTLPLHFDYSQKVAVAMTPLLRTGHEFASDVPDTAVALTDSGLELIHNLPPGQTVQLWVQLKVPDMEYQELVQVTGELMTADGRVVARSTRTWVKPQKHFLARLLPSLITLPLRVLGLRDEALSVRLVLLDRYVDKARFPAAMFKASLTSRYGTVMAPPVYQAELHVLQLLPWPKSWLYPLRPGVMWAVLLATSGAGMATAGLVLAAVIAYVAKQSLYPSGQAGDGEQYGQYASLPGYPDDVDADVDDADDEDLKSEDSFEGEMKGRLTPAGSHDGRPSASAASQRGGSSQQAGQGAQGQERQGAQVREPYSKCKAPESPFSDEQQQRDALAGAWEKVDGDASVLSNVTGEGGEGPAGSSAAGDSGAAVARSGSGGAVKRRGFSLF